MISQTVDYAMRAMSNLAALGGAATTSEAIATATRVPQAYLSKVMRDLVRAELVKSFRGPNGGFVLARDIDSISLLDIVNAVDPIRRAGAFRPGDPRCSDPCPLHRCLDEALAHMEQRLRSTSLGSVLSGTRPASDSRAHVIPATHVPSKE